MLLEIDQHVRVESDHKRTVVAEWQDIDQRAVAEAQAAVFGYFVQHRRMLRRYGSSSPVT